MVYFKLTSGKATVAKVFNTKKCFTGISKNYFASAQILPYRGQNKVCNQITPPFLLLKVDSQVYLC